MTKTRFALKAVAGTVATAVLVLGSLAAPAEAKDTGWGKSSKNVTIMKDTGWGP